MKCDVSTFYTFRSTSDIKIRVFVFKGSWSILWTSYLLQSLQSHIAEVTRTHVSACDGLITSRKNHLWWSHLCCCCCMSYKESCSVLSVEYRCSWYRVSPPVNTPRSVCNNTVFPEHCSFCLRLVNNVDYRHLSTDYQITCSSCPSAATSKIVNLSCS